MKTEYIIINMKKNLFKILIPIFSVMLLCCGCDKDITNKKTEITTEEITEITTETKSENIIEKTTNSSTETTTEDVTEFTTEATTELVIPDDTELVLVKDYIPDIYVELRYATTNNFTGQIIYDFTDARLRYGTIKKLAQVQEQVKKDGFCIKIWDAYRPTAAQFRLWEVCPNSTYVANPNTGYSSHSRGNTVDITLVRKDGSYVTMPTEFDDFSSKADRYYNDCSEEERQNALYLENIMKENGFEPYSGEWWHFSDTTSYNVE